MRHLGPSAPFPALGSAPVARPFQLSTHVAALATALLVTACGGSTGSGETPPNLLLVTVDTARADHIGCYGYEAANTPTLDGLAARGALFEEAYTPAPMTLPAHATMLTGLLPPQHGARVNGEHRLADDIPTLAERLSARGFRTGAFVAAFVLDETFGLARGFDRYDDDLSTAYEQEVAERLSVYRSGEEVVDAALDWFDDEPTRGPDARPFFAWVHLYDAHYPWHPHEGDGQNGSYDSELAFADRQVGRLMDFLEREGLVENTLVVAVADHGEGLGDHGEIEHGYLLNEEVLRIPWIMAGPGVRAGQRVSALVSLEDLKPTVLELFGMPRPPDLPGQSLARALDGQTIESTPSYAETDLPWSSYRWAPQRSLTTKEYKYVRTPQAELYDRKTDRGELSNLVDVRPDLRAKLDAQLREMEETLGERSSEGTSLSKTELASLAALGYVAGDGSSEVPDDLSGLPDVKQRRNAKILSERLRRGESTGSLEPEERLAMMRELVAESPETPSFQRQLGAALVELGYEEEGIEKLNAALQRDSSSADSFYTLGDVLEQRGRHDEARPLFEAALGLDPSFAAAHVGMGNVLRAEGRPDLAAGQYSEALRLAPRYPEAHFNLALTLLDRNQPARALENFQKALDQRPGWDIALSSIARLHANMGRNDEALAAYEAALEAQPGAADLHNDYGVILDAMGRSEEAAKQYLEALEIQPEFHHPHLNLATQAQAAGRDEEARKHLEAALKLVPGSADTTARLARFFAACPDPAQRDPERAVALAERASELTGQGHAQTLDTLAVAYASAGRFADAISTAHRGVKRAQLAGNESLAKEIEERLALYALGEAYVEPRESGSESSGDTEPTESE